MLRLLQRGYHIRRGQHEFNVGSHFSYRSNMKIDLNQHRALFWDGGNNDDDNDNDDSEGSKLDKKKDKKKKLHETKTIHNDSKITSPEEEQKQSFEVKTKIPPKYKFESVQKKILWGMSKSDGDIDDNGENDGMDGFSDGGSNGRGNRGNDIVRLSHGDESPRYPNLIGLPVINRPLFPGIISSVNVTDPVSLNICLIV